jgi:protein-L-isoaspartate O-methyltransferase
MRPSAWLIANVDLIPPGARVLDVASGSGRHAVFLAERGFTVHAVDRDADTLAELAATAAARGLRITTEVKDLELGAPSLGRAEYGAVIVFNYLHRPLMPAIVEAISPGGVLIYETFTVGQAQRGHPRNPAFLLRDGELATLIAPLVIVRAREGDFEGKLISSIAARR